MTRHPNPTVSINVTARELRVLVELLGYNTHCITLRDKLSAAEKEMQVANRQKNREVKQARRARARSSHPTTTEAVPTGAASVVKEDE